jgi:copper chaperone NosL
MKPTIFFLAMLALLACSRPQPKPIKYGSDLCAYCQMMVTDKKFGAELVTEKGRYHFFDSAECMLRYMAEDEPGNYAHILITHLGTPDALADARNSYYVISEEIPSPMGGNLSAYATQAEAEAVAAKHKGTAYTFAQLAELYKVPQD